ncbi:hypothetical protein [Pseudoduganella violacea]|uniref:Lipoprotein SmpA/OmlA domain-containing protein n=1 Tax=Pseudoduganella violacea TaxID=1715466 RepID=A0A7W5B5T0_9BURK|nr:hypothetical protein [Pseudoduganella violacea]MBB3117117.1 hypothetical protein [Pseudoduganella violacea]
MHLRFHSGLAALGLLLLTACASPTRTSTGVSVTEAQTRLVVGRSSKAEVAAALGRAAVTSFPSGYEVWVYNDKLELPALVSFVPLVGSLASAVEVTAQNRELVILFDPSGTVRKYQMRVDGSRLEKLVGQ